MKKFLVIMLMLISTIGGYAEMCEKNGNTQTSSSSSNERTLTKKYHAGNPRSIFELPVIRLEGNVLHLITFIPSCTLQLVNENEEIFYEAYIPEGTEQWQLPTDELEGCELRLIIDDVCYYCIL